jgi:hypothetical protein
MLLCSFLVWCVCVCMCMCVYIICPRESNTCPSSYVGENQNIIVCSFDIEALEFQRSRYMNCSTIFFVLEKIEILTVQYN